MSPDCTCFPTPCELQHRYGDRTEPGSALEYNPECPEHGDGGSGAQRRLAQIIAPMLLRDGHNGTMVSRDDDQLASDIARWLLADEDARRLLLDASTADTDGHPDVTLRTHRDGRVLVEVPTGSTNPLLERAWVLIKPDPEGEIRWAHEYNDPEFAERIVLSPMDGPPYRCYPDCPTNRTGNVEDCTCLRP